jgi:limonene-1,2-epoxide hydrolase
VDSMYRADGTKIMEFRLMGALELRDGLIVRYTDYLDTAPIAAAEHL